MNNFKLKIKKIDDWVFSNEIRARIILGIMSAIMFFFPIVIYFLWIK
jgi:hypothetical protein